MRHLQEIPHPHFRMGLYAWNNKFILKIETGPYEQTYKISEMDMATAEEVIQLLDDDFLERVAQRFGEMDADWMATQTRHEFD